MAVHGQHHIFWLDVAMDVALGMKRHSVDQKRVSNPVVEELKRKNNLSRMEGSSFLIKPFLLQCTVCGGFLKEYILIAGKYLVNSLEKVSPRGKLHDEEESFLGLKSGEKSG